MSPPIPPPSQRSLAVRELMTDHVAEHLQLALKKAEEKKPSEAQKARAAAIEKYQLEAILPKAAGDGTKASPASGAYAATHIAKGIHPDPKVSVVTNLRPSPAELADQLRGDSFFIGSYLLDANSSIADTTGNGAYNAATYELYLVLDLKFEGRPIYQWLEERDAEVVSAFNGAGGGVMVGTLDLASRCVELMLPKVKAPASGSLLKQLYWAVENAPAKDDAYHLLAPLYPASLVHELYERIHTARFSKESKDGREARRHNKYYEGVLCDYPSLAVVKMGGTKSHNISHLNSVRSATNYLLSCSPPAWGDSGLRAPLRMSSIFERIYGKLPEVSEAVYALRDFLASDPAKNMPTRNKQDGYTGVLTAELVQLAAKYQNGLTPGWSSGENVELNEDECLWLDPYRATIEEEFEFRERWLQLDWPNQIAARFANWLNAQLDDALPVGEAEARHWRRELLLDETEDGWMRELDGICRSLRASLPKQLEPEPEVQS